ncbi:Calcium-binding mitochondrial carrier protein [Chlorella vulgaris]
MQRRLPAVARRRRHYAFVAQTVLSCTAPSPGAACAAEMSQSASGDPDDLETLFAGLDSDRDGQLQREEVQAALRRLGLPASQHYMGDLFSQYGGSQSIDYKEFRRYVATKERSMRAVFSAIDADGDERLDAGEVHRAAAALGLSVAPEEADRMIALLDGDDDGKISFSEFRRFCVLLPGAQVSHTNILSAWVDSASWVSSMEYRLGHVPPSQGLERLLAGGVAGAVSRTVVAPLERLRSIMMADRSATRLGPVLQRMWADGGLRGLFRGNLATVTKVFPSSAISFAAYDACKDVLQAYSGPGAGDLSTQQKLFAGLVAGAAATQISVAQGRSASYISILRGMAAERGLKGLFQGYSAGLLNTSLSNALGFASYEVLVTAYRARYNEQPSTGTRGILGGGAAFFTMAATMPLENVMRRLQVQGRPGFPRQYSGPLNCTLLMLRQEGVSSFWRGSLSSFAKVVPSIAATRVLYEAIVELRGIGGVRRYRVGADD